MSRDAPRELPILTDVVELHATGSFPKPERAPEAEPALAGGLLSEEDFAALQSLLVSRTLNLTAVAAPNAKAAADFFADVKHGRLVALAFTDHNATTHRYGIHRFTHRFDGNVIGILTIALAHRACRGDCRGFTNAEEIQRQFAICPQLVTHKRSSPDSEV